MDKSSFEFDRMIRKVRKSVSYRSGEKNTSCNHKNWKKKMMKSRKAVVQKLYETCKEIFANGKAGFVPPPADIRRLQLILVKDPPMKPKDVGLSPDMPCFEETENQEAPPPITYVHIYACDTFSIGIFCLPPSGVIPLHNHPGMTVFSKLLFGSMHVKSYDWADNILNTTNQKLSHLRYSQSSGFRLAKVHIESDKTAPCKSSILYPAAGGNMHCFEALTPCAILDVLGPPYSEVEGRHCTYYRDHPYTSFPELELLDGEDKEEEYAWLEEREEPEEFVVVGASYEGPDIVDNF
ncbi:hypothetical protein LguiA_028202 [Lonicera macranthoides]